MKEIQSWLADQNEPQYRVGQVLNWIYRRGVLSFDAMTNLPQKLRDGLKANFRLSTLENVSVQDSGDGETTKYLWRLSSGKLVESVLILSGKRATVCVSSQVGCPARCAFCASGKKGFFQNLNDQEIVEQVIRIRKRHSVTHVVFMGMGEPMENLENVLSAIQILHKQLDISQRRITVSTVGVIEGIRQMMGCKVNLVLSLHAPNQHIRKKIIPYARKYDLFDLLATMDEYSAISGRDVTYEYTLMAGVNDQPEHARELVDLLKNKQCTVNLIPYNPVPGLQLKRPDRRTIEVFRQILTQGKIVNTCRYTKGVDIAAACGQLALQESLA